MTRLDEARALLEALGMPPAQRNENAVYTLLGFANIGPDDPWSEASAVRRNPHDIIVFAQRAWQKQYAENTRETIRHADQIAWDTEVWIAEAPSHLLHYNGDRFYGPR